MAKAKRKGVKRPVKKTTPRRKAKPVTKRKVVRKTSTTKKKTTRKTTKSHTTKKTVKRAKKTLVKKVVKKVPKRTKKKTSATKRSPKKSSAKTITQPRLPKLPELPPVRHIVKRHGHEEIYDSRKVYASVYASALNCHYSESASEFIAERVTSHVDKWIATKTAVSSEDIRECILKNINDADIALMYKHHLDLC